VDQARLGAQDVKDALKRNTQEAAARGVFGVPSFDAGGEIFWGADAIGFLNACLADSATLANEEMRRVDALPVGAARKT
jgi:2-hydroxychromene-2-carboxylate isomerase